MSIQSNRETVTSATQSVFTPAVARATGRADGSLLVRMVSIVAAAINTQINNRTNRPAIAHLFSF